MDTKMMGGGRQKENRDYMMTHCLQVLGGYIKNWTAHFWRGRGETRFRTSLGGGEMEPPLWRGIWQRQRSSMCICSVAKQSHF